ncbi:MAG: cohesin domain-containing protein [bacterium]
MKKVFLAVFSVVFVCAVMFSSLPSPVYSQVSLPSVSISPVLTLIQPVYLLCIEQDSGALDIEGARGRIGQEVKIPVRIQNAPNGVAALGFEVAYNTAVLKYTGFERGNLVTSFNMFDVNIDSPGKLKVGGFTIGSGVSKGASGYLVWLKFTVVGGQEKICYSLTLSNLTDEIANFPQTGGCFCIQSCNGDLNEDAAITPMDALIAFKCYLGSGDCPDCTDVNEDGKVTPADALCLFQKYLGKPSCLDEPAQPVTVLSPARGMTSSQEFSIDNQNHIVIKVTFSDPVQTATVVVRKTLILDAEKDHNAAGTISWSSDRKELTFRTTNTVSNLLQFNPDGFFSLQLIGTDTGNGAIKDDNGNPLDGDENGTYGGNYTTGFCLIG